MKRIEDKRNDIYLNHECMKPVRRRHKNKYDFVRRVRQTALGSNLQKHNPVAD